MNFHLVVGQLESEPIIPKGSETDVQLRIATKELNVKSVRLIQRTTPSASSEVLSISYTF